MDAHDTDLIPADDPRCFTLEGRLVDIHDFIEVNGFALPDIEAIHALAIGDIITYGATSEPALNLHGPGAYQRPVVLRRIADDDPDTGDLHCEHAEGLCRETLGAPCDEPALYAANMGAGGIDYRCPAHLAAVLADPDNIAAGVTRADYMAADPADPQARCEACDVRVSAVHFLTGNPRACVPADPYTSRRISGDVTAVTCPDCLANHLYLTHLTRKGAIQ